MELSLKVSQCCLGSKQEARFDATIGDQVIVSRDNNLFKGEIISIISPFMLIVSDKSSQSMQKITIASSDVLALVIQD